MVWRAKICLACIACTALCGGRLSAQDVKQDTIAGKTHQIDKVVVTARRAPHKVTSAVPVQMMYGQDIDRLGIQNMADAVRRFAGAGVKDYGGIGGLKTVSVRNMGAAHTAVSYDGVAVSNCQAGQIDIGRFSLDNVSALSLAIGHTEDLLQSARLYASAGVLSIETEKPHFDEGHSSAFRARLRGGSFGYVAPSLRWWQKLGWRTRLAADIGYTRADGNYPFTLTNGKYQTEEKRNNSDITSWQGEATLYHTFHDGGELDVKGYYYYSRRGLPGGVTLYNPLSDERLWDENAFVQAHYKKRFSEYWSLQSQAKYNYGWNKYTDEGKEYAGGHYRAVHRQDEYYFSTTALFQPWRDWQFSLAQDASYNKLRSTLPDCPFPERYTLQSAFNVRYKRGMLTTTATLLHTYIKEKLKTGTPRKDFNRFTPSLSVNLQPWEAETLFLRLMYKSTFRTPTFNDLYYYQMGNKKLRPETANEFNAGITWSRSSFLCMDNFSLTLDGYFNDVKDKIVAFPTTYVWKMMNYGKVCATGVDASLVTAFKLPADLHLTFTAVYSFQKAIDFTDPKSKNYKGQLPYTPRHSGNMSLSLETPWVNVGYSVVGVGKRYYLSQNISDNLVDGYAEHTLSLSRMFRLKHCRLHLQGEVNNLTDVQYEVIKYYPMPGRSYRASLTLEL